MSGKVAFIEDMRHIPPMKGNEPFTGKARIFLEKKLSAVSSVDNRQGTHELNIQFYCLSFLYTNLC